MQTQRETRVRVRQFLGILGAASLAACGGGGFGCGDFGVGPCGPTPKFETAIDVAVADFNGDGRPDVALPVDEGANTPGVVAVFEHANVADKGYGPRTDYPVAISFPSRIIAADLDGDGRPDLITATAESTSSTVALLLNNTGNPGTFRAGQTLSVPYVNDIAVADLNGDSRPDLIIAGSSLMVALQNTGTPGSFAPPMTLYASGSSSFDSVAVGDLDGDGTPDVAVADDTGVTVLFLTPGAATPTVARSVRVYTNPTPSPNTGLNAVAIADVDGDGRNDLVIADGVNSVVAAILQSHITPGEFMQAVTYALPATDSGFDRLVIVDLNGDGHADIVVAASSAVLVYLQNASQPGTFLPASSYAASLSANGVAVADVDGDGLPDIVSESGTGASLPIGALGPPGVLYQDPANPGHFLPMQDLQTQ